MKITRFVSILIFFALNAFASVSPVGKLEFKEMYRAGRSPVGPYGVAVFSTQGVASSDRVYVVRVGEDRTSITPISEPLSHNFGFSGTPWGMGTAWSTDGHYGMLQQARMFEHEGFVLPIFFSLADQSAKVVLNGSEWRSVLRKQALAKFKEKFGVDFATYADLPGDAGMSLNALKLDDETESLDWSGPITFDSTQGIRLKVSGEYGFFDQTHRQRARAKFESQCVVREVNGNLRLEGIKTKFSGLALEH